MMTSSNGMETFSALLALCEGNPPVTGGFASQRPVTHWCCAWTNRWTNNGDANDLRCHHTRYDVTIMFTKILTVPHSLSVRVRCGVCLVSRTSYSYNASVTEILFNSLWPSDTIWRCRSRSTLAQEMSCCLTATSHYLNQCCLIISVVLCQSFEANFTRDTWATNYQY